MKGLVTQGSLSYRNMGMSSRWDVSLVTIAFMQNQFFDSSHEGPVLGSGVAYGVQG